MTDDANATASPPPDRPATDDPSNQPEATAAGTTAPDSSAHLDVTAIGVAVDKLRARARHELGEFAAQYQKLDGLVLVLGVCVAFVAARWHRHLIEPAHEPMALPGLTLVRPAVWELADGADVTAPRGFGADPTAPSEAQVWRYHARRNPTATMEIRIAPRHWNNTVTSRELARRNRWGSLVHVTDSQVESIGGQDWLRTSFTFAEARTGEPTLRQGLEFVGVTREHEYVIGVFGSARQVAHWERVVAPSLRLAERSAMPLVPTSTANAQLAAGSVLTTAAAATVMVIAAELRGGVLVAHGAGSGFVVSEDGAVLTNLHVIQTGEARLADAFIIARDHGQSATPTFVCAGAPRRSAIVERFDLALLRCDMDLDGRAWSPTALGPWPALRSTAAAPPAGDAVWVLGFPDLGGGRMTISAGQILGTTGEGYLRTDADISRGNSGGPVVNARGDVIGVATAFSTRATDPLTQAKAGLVRPISTAGPLLEISAHHLPDGQSN